MGASIPNRVILISDLATLGRWRQEYNMIRRHSSLNDVTPAEFAGRFEE
jgi:transposase InsO family protein